MSNMRDIILGKSGGHCWYCGDDLKNKKWHADHFYPVKRVDGKMTRPERDVIENLVPACVPCNLMKSDGDIYYLRWLVTNFIKRLNKDISIYRNAKRYGLVTECNSELYFYFEKMGLQVEYKEEAE